PVHGGQLEAVGFCLGDRHADVARGVADHEREQLRRRELGGEDQVALVLAVLVVYDDHCLAGRDVLDGPFDRIQGHDWLLTSFSTYFATTSTSRLTGSPTPLAPSVVSFSVVGMSPTPNDSSVTCVTVRDTPSTVIDPFSTTYRASPPGSENVQSPPSWARIVPTPST